MEHRAAAEIAQHRQANGFVSELEAKNLHPLWDRYQRITPIKPQAQDAPFLWRWSEVEPFLHRSVAEVSINDIERRALILVNPAFGGETVTTSNLIAAFTVLDPGDRAHIHELFPATLKATDDTWSAGEMMHSQLFGGRAEGTDYAQFLQINTPLKVDGKVVAILMLNKFADPVAAAVRMKTMRVTSWSVGVFLVGLALFKMRPEDGIGARDHQLVVACADEYLCPCDRRRVAGQDKNKWRGETVHRLRQRNRPGPQAAPGDRGGEPQGHSGALRLRRGRNSEVPVAPGPLT